MTNPVINRSAYKAGPNSKLVKLELIVMVDSVPGWGDCIDDHINLIFRDDLYVQSAQVLDDGVVINPRTGMASIQL